MGKKIKLYHGTTYNIDTIDVTKGKPFKDFGAGFYLSPSEKHSLTLALRNKTIEAMRIKLRGIQTDVCAYIYTYEFDTDNQRELNVMEFPKANREWMRFVVSNRNAAARIHDYDMVIGPTANDDTRVAIQAFFAGAYGDTNSDEAIDILIKRIMPYQLPVQYFFGTQRAADLLVFKGRELLNGLD